MLMTEAPGRHLVILKADPGEAHAPRQQYSHITPGRYLNKEHWITLEGGQGVDKKPAEESVTDSHRLVVAHPPKAEQPADPRTYGSGRRAAR
jgi:predicted DNA-binding protein (MmcQ/YjbR family)